MALVQELTTEHGIEINQAYYRVEDIVISYPSKRAWVTVAVYASQDARHNGMRPIATKQIVAADHQEFHNTMSLEDGSINSELLSEITQFSDFFSTELLSVEGANPVSQGYEFLKSLAEYSSAVDA